MASKRHFTGTVTKMHDNFGFIDDDVFFQLPCCEGRIPGVGDVVVVDAQFNPNMPFKWTASRVKLAPKYALQAQQQQNAVAQLQAFNAMQSSAQGRTQFPQGLKFVHGGAGILGAAPSAVMGQRMNQQRHQMSGPKGNRHPQRGRQQSPQKRNRDNRDQKKRRTRSPPPKSSPAHHQRNVSTDRSDKTQRRPTPRYMVQYTKKPLTSSSSDVLGLKILHTNMYVPSDFYSVDFNWQDTFSLQQPHIPRKCQFHILQKDVETLEKLDDGILNPPDSDHTWVAKVMLLQAPSKDEIYKQCCHLAEETSEHFLHQSRVYKFLVGNKGKKELMAIGGSWSPSLDGSDPANNPRTLVNTAIRTCRALTGIDLSKCTNWRRMLEIQYHRNSEVRKGRALPDRVETTIIFLPDIHSCMPTSSEYSTLQESYLNKCEAVIQAEQEDITPDPSASQQTAPEEESQPPAPDIESTTDVPTDQKMEESAVKEEPMVEEGLTTPVKVKDTADDNAAAAEPAEGTPTHHTKLDIKALKVPLLRKELESRGLSPRGLKAALVTRLTEAVEAEVQKEQDDKILLDDEDVEMQVLDEAGEKDEPAIEAKDSEAEKKEHANGQEDKEPGSSEEQQEVKPKEEPTKEQPEKKEDENLKKEAGQKPKKELDVDQLRKHYTLPATCPVIPVHPNTEFKKGSFECFITPLSNLLSYRQDDNKESIFEVSLFAEAFTEMLQRDHAFNIYKALCNPLPEIKVEMKEDTDEGSQKANDENADDGEPQAKKSKSESEEESKKSDQETKSGKGEESEKTNEKESEDGKQPEKSAKDLDAKAKKPAPKPEEKMVTLRKDLLLSFVYFDQTQCGYIKSSDMADIIHSIGLGLSRSQIRELQCKYLEHDNLKYRKLTDVPASQVEAYQELLANLPGPDVDTLASGNKSLMPDITMNGGSHSDPLDCDGIVSFKGAVVDIKALQDKLATSEEDQAKKETTIVKLTTQLESVTKELSETKDEKDKLQSEYDTTLQKLSETQTELKSVSDTKAKFEKTLKSIAKSIDTAMPKDDEK